MINRYLPLLVFLSLVVTISLFSSQFGAGEWYYKLIKPSWNPPPWVFGPVWSALYVMMAVAMWRVWVSGHPNRVGSLLWWVIQLTLNAAWSWLFFGLNRTGFALLELTALLGVAILCTRAFSSASRTAALLMIPYILWLGFAWVLNLALWRLNGGGIGTIIGS